MNLLEYRSNVTSEHGEDGILQKLLEVVGEQGRYCIELGALDGKHGSNVWNLIQNYGWSALLIEADSTYFDRLKARFQHHHNVTCINAFVSFEGSSTLDRLCESANVPLEPTLLSLDIDGNDYYIWKSLHKYLPKIVIVEFNPSIPNHVSFVQPRDMSIQQGSSLRAMVELGKEKGYELAAVTDTNAFFVRKELYPALGLSDNSLDLLHADHSYETSLYQLYDGTLKIDGNKKLIWHGIPIDESRLQILPPAKRKYPARTNPQQHIRVLKYYVRKFPFYSTLQKFRRFIGS